MIFRVFIYNLIILDEKVKNSDILWDFSQRETSPDNIHELALKTTSELSEENCDFIWGKNIRLILVLFQNGLHSLP